MDRGLQKADGGTPFAGPLTLTIQQAVELSGLSRSFIYKRFNAGDIPRLKAGKKVLILRSDMVRYLQAIREVPEVPCDST